MTKVVAAEYDAAENVLRLVEPVEGLQDHERVQVTIVKQPIIDPDRPWLAFSGIMEGERGEDFARAVEELFPPWTGEDD